MAPDAATLDTPTTTTPAPAPTTSVQSVNAGVQSVNAPSAPAIVESSATPPTSERPKSMLAAFEQVAAQTETATSPPDAATKPQGVPTPQADASVKPPPGPIPFQDHERIIANTRTKSVQERDSQWMHAYPGLHMIKPEVWAGWVQTAQSMTTSPTDFLRGYVTEMAQHPEFGPAVKAELARLAGRHSGNGQQPEASYDPDVAVMDANGQIVGRAFSAERTTALIKKAVADAIGEQVTPLQREAAQRRAWEQQRQEAARATEQHQHNVTRIDKGIDRALKILDGKSELLAEVDALVAQMPNITSAEAAVEAAIDAAFQVREKRIIPTLQGKAKEEALADLRNKARANTANGAGVTTTPSTRPRNAKELAAVMEQLETGQRAAS